LKGLKKKTELVNIGKHLLYSDNFSVEDVELFLLKAGKSVFYRRCHDNFRHQQLYL